MSKVVYDILGGRWNLCTIFWKPGFNRSIRWYFISLQLTNL